MADPLFMGPPEVIAARFEAGPGPVSTLANMLVWMTETISRELATTASAVNTATTAPQWVGLAGVASTAKSGLLNTSLQTLGAWTAHKVAVTQAAVDAYTAAASTVIPAVVSQTNRDEWIALNASNILGQNTPAIIERDLEYFGEHWPHNSGVGMAYSAAMTGLAAALSVPPPPTFAGAPPAAPAAAGQALMEAATTPEALGQAPLQAAQTGAQAATAPAQLTGQLGSMLQQGPQLISSAAQPIRSLTQTSSQMLQSVSGAPQTLLGSFAPDQAPAAAAEVVAEPWRAGGGAAAGVGAGGYPGAPLTTFTRPASTFGPEEGGRPTGRAGVLNAAELRGPTAGAPVGRGMLPVLPAAAGMAGRPTGDTEREEVARARIVGVGGPR